MSYPRKDPGELRGRCVDLQLDEYVEAALEASCAALMALDRVRTDAASNERVTRRLSLAIAALRQAVADLRDLQAGRGSPASHGFVAGGRPGSSPRVRDVERMAGFRALS